MLKNLVTLPPYFALTFSVFSFSFLSFLSFLSVLLSFASAFILLFTAWTCQDIPGHSNIHLCNNVLKLVEIILLYIILYYIIILLSSMHSFELFVIHTITFNCANVHNAFWYNVLLVNIYCVVSVLIISRKCLYQFIHQQKFHVSVYSSPDYSCFSLLINRKFCISSLINKKFHISVYSLTEN